MSLYRRSYSGSATKSMVVTPSSRGNTLFNALLRPAWPMLATTINLIVVPHRSLHYVPFSALWYEPVGDDASPRQYLKNRFYLTTIPSASYLPYLARISASDREFGPAVVLGTQPVTFPVPTWKRAGSPPSLT